MCSLKEALTFNTKNKYDLYAFQNIHRQQLSAQCNSKHPTESYNITYLYLDTSMISCLKIIFLYSTYYSNCKRSEKFPCKFSLAVIHTVQCFSPCNLQVLVKFVCYFQSLWTEVKKASLFSGRLKLLVKSMQIRKKSESYWFNLTFF